MTAFEEKSHSFIVRIWIEPREIEGELPEWRGLIENPRTGQRRYFCRFQEMHDFLAPFLEAWGANPEQVDCGKRGDN